MGADMRLGRHFEWKRKLFLGRRYIFQTLGVSRQVYGLCTKKNRCKTVSYNDFLLF